MNTLISLVPFVMWSACTRGNHPVPPICTDSLVRYADWPELEASGAAEWSVDFAGDGGRVVVLGLHHRDDPRDPQFAAIDRAWAALRPTVAFYEGPDRPISDTADATIAATGESGYIRFLARRDGIPAKRLDPDPRAEAAYVGSRHLREQLLVFYVVREVVRLRDRKRVPREALSGAVDQMMVRAKELGLDGSFRSTADFEAAYRDHAGDPPDWRDAPEWWFSPLPRADERFTHRINRDSSEFRNTNMFEVLAAEVRAKQRVFAGVGSNHVPMIAPGLRCQLGLPPATPAKVDRLAPVPVQR